MISRLVPRSCFQQDRSDPTEGSRGKRLLLVLALRCCKLPTDPDVALKEKEKCRNRLQLTSEKIKKSPNVVMKKKEVQ